jgi:hypothetical protein
LAKDTTDWKNKKDMLDTEQAAQTHLQHQLAELNQEQLTAKVEAATAARDDAAASLQAAEQGVQAATRELAGVILGCEEVINMFRIPAAQVLLHTAHK